MKLNETFLAQMREATALLQSEGPAAATVAIQRALNASEGPFDEPPPAPDHPNRQVLQDDATEARQRRAAPPEGGHEHGNASANTRTNARTNEHSNEHNNVHAKASACAADRFRRMRAGVWDGSIAGQAQDEIEDAEVSQHDTPDKGRFLSGSCSNMAGTRTYKLYVPSGYTGAPLPLVVMLHGCTQNPDDFARGTGMNALAEEQNFFVVYPAQAKSANNANCWNWFQPTHQARDRGEPSLIADITRKVAREYAVDDQRIYVAGLSAGAAMALILGARYPDLYAAVGVHSGLPIGVARDAASAFAAMRGGKGKTSPRAATAHPPASLTHVVPVIVFHGDRDRTVHFSNGDRVLRQCIASAALDRSAPRAEVKSTANGRRYTRILHRTEEGRVIAEHWTLHGAGHAWAGGSGKGSHTDTTGPDASREMVRFFFSHARQKRPS